MKNLFTLSESFGHYQSRILRAKEILSYAQKTSQKELTQHLKNIISFPNTEYFIQTFLSFSRSSVWISYSRFHLFKSYMNFRPTLNPNLKNPKAQNILAGITNKNSVNADDHFIFKVIYDELVYSHLNKAYQTSFKIPPLNVTIVLVSGVLNEIFSTPAFTRGAEHLLRNYNIKYFAPLVDGTKGSKENSRFLKKQIDQYIKNNPKEKLWFFCFSKGGVDTLHYFQSEGMDLSQNILGASMIASPILGSEHEENITLKTINTFGDLQKLIFRILFKKHTDYFAEGLQSSLSHSYRNQWFKKNFKEIPSRPFYTALAFQAHWTELHFWMILTKFLLRSSQLNDGIVDTDKAQFPSYFNGINLGIIKGHHLIGSRSSLFDQEALMMAHLIFLIYKNLIPEEKTSKNCQL